jgi:hypothetical protein
MNQIFCIISTRASILLFVLFLAEGFSAIAQNDTLRWARKIDNSMGHAISIDKSGNVYSIGTFSGTVDFDPGPGIYNLTASLGGVYILKLDSSGNFVWAREISGTDFDRPQAIAVDKWNNVYTLGTFQGTTDFDPGTGTFNLTTVHQDIFISKLDSTGNFVWARKIGGDQNNLGTSITTDTSGNIYITGEFSDTVDFDPGSATYDLVSNGGGDIFITELDTGGNLLWVKQIGGFYSEGGASITLDNYGNIYTAGSFQFTLDFDPGPATNNLSGNAGYTSAFILKLNSLGNFVWAKQFADLGGYYSGVLSMTVDPQLNVYTTGVFQDTMDFDPGTGVYNLISAGGQDIFVSKLDSSGNFVWAARMGSIGSDIGYSIAVDNSGGVYTCGSFAGTVDFDPGSGTYNLTSAGGSQRDIFISKFDSSGNFKWTNQFGSNHNDEGVSIVLDPKENIYAIGYFNDTVDFDPNSGIYMLVASSGNIGSFILKLTQGPLIDTSGSSAISNNYFQESYKLYPNPTRNYITIENAGSCNFRITNLIGETLLTGKIETAKTQLDITQLLPGTYFIEVADINGNKRVNMLIKN